MFSQKEMAQITHFGLDRDGRQCYVNSKSEQRCDAPATKCVLVADVEMADMQIWLCEEHYADENVRGLFEAIWDRVTY
jgi:hypothetical protein